MGIPRFFPLPFISVTNLEDTFHYNKNAIQMNVSALN